jgi:hypothetical protein
MTKNKEEISLPAIEYEGAARARPELHLCSTSKVSTASTEAALPTQLSYGLHSGPKRDRGSLLYLVYGTLVSAPLHGITRNS